jgi:hypothetical protein
MQSKLNVEGETHPNPPDDEMRITQEKKDFIKAIASGLSVRMTMSWRADEIAAGADDDIEVYIRDNILTSGKSMTGSDRHWFSTDKFCAAVEQLTDGKLYELLLYLYDVEVLLSEAFDESEEVDAPRAYEELVEKRSAVTFKRFLEQK